MYLMYLMTPLAKESSNECQIFMGFKFSLIKLPGTWFILVIPQSLATLSIT